MVKNQAEVLLVMVEKALILKFDLRKQSYVIAVQFQSSES